MRSLSARAPAVALAAALAAQGCALLVGIRELSTRRAIGPIRCDVPTECPIAGNVCFVRTCVGGLCGLNESPLGTPVASQIAGDCKVVQCDAEGRPAEAPANDPFDDGEACTIDGCAEGVRLHTLRELGATCGSGVCDANGRCVQCLDDRQCAADRGCASGVCVKQTCRNEALDEGETDVDCGGLDCTPCGDGARCRVGEDCDSLVCTDEQCQAPACDDTVANGAETDVDCGGSNCSLCGAGARCGDERDCESRVCGGPSGPRCLAPSCDDGTQNGDENAPDCGGQDCFRSCDVGEECADDNDCFSGVCEDDVCQAETCSDGVPNGDEEGTDCGGDCATPCPPAEQLPPRERPPPRGSLAEPREGAPSALKTFNETKGVARGGDGAR